MTGTALAVCLVPCSAKVGAQVALPQKDVHADGDKIEVAEMAVALGSQISLDSGLSNADSRNRIHFCPSERRAFLLATWDGRRALLVLLRLGLFDPRT